ncbi:30S ribosomal protein S5 [Candidatus Saccharibacteria bacterium]|nr:30S ribosomal protein S5 [Candidatus Saccharibacteria bacterium]
MSEEIKKTTKAVVPKEAVSPELVSGNAEGPQKVEGDSSASARNDNADVKSAAPANAKNGEAPKRKFGSATNFSSENMSRDNRGGRGRSDNRGEKRGERRDNRRGGRGDKPAEEKVFEEQTIAIDRVSRTVKGGRRLRFKALVVVGDKKSRVGVGVAKGRDVQMAIEKATDVAKKNIVTIPLQDTTIPHEVELKFGGAHVLLKPAAPGTGIIAGGVVRTIIGVTGISNLLSKSLGSTNKVNIAYATVEALKTLVPRDQWINADKSKAKKAVKPASVIPTEVEGSKKAKKDSSTSARNDKSGAKEAKK